jgi:hypothetical protein
MRHWRSVIVFFSATLIYGSHYIAELLQMLQKKMLEKGYYVMLAVLATAVATVATITVTGSLYATTDSGAEDEEEEEDSSSSSSSEEESESDNNNNNDQEGEAGEQDTKQVEPLDGKVYTQQDLDNMSNEELENLGLRPQQVPPQQQPQQPLQPLQQPTVVQDNQTTPTTTTTPPTTPTTPTEDATFIVLRSEDGTSRVLSCDSQEARAYYAYRCNNPDSGSENDGVDN